MRDKLSITQELNGVFPRHEIEEWARKYAQDFRFKLKKVFGYAGDMTFTIDRVKVEDDRMDTDSFWVVKIESADKVEFGSFAEAKNLQKRYLELRQQHVRDMVVAGTDTGVEWPI